MNITVKKIPFSEVNYFSKRDKLYTQSPEIFENFISYSPDLLSFKQAMDHRLDQSFERETLVKVLHSQYERLQPSTQTKDHIRLMLKGNTFTVITAHQPNLFTGPLYTIYKIISVLNLCDQLKKTYPQSNFVPLFISGGEDHDFEEMNHFHFYQNKFEWINNESGPVARMSTKGVSKVLSDLKEKLGNSEHAHVLSEIIASGLKEFNVYGEFNFYLIDKLFSKYGLVVLNMDHPELKRLFIPIMKEELLKRSSKPLVEATQKEIEKLGFKSQAHARDINLFYLQIGRRDRIEYVDEKYRVVDTELSFSDNEILEELESHPECFSPNVILRPLYQELVLPNLAYVGGGGEIAYWLERKSQFEHHNLRLPILLRRNSVQWIDKSSSTQLNKLGISQNEIFEAIERILKNYIKDQREEPLDLIKEKTSILDSWDEIVSKAKSIDPTFSKSLLAEKKKIENKVDHISQRFIRIEKQKKETEVNKIRKLKEKLFPGNGLQERYDNFIQYYIKYGDEFIESLKKSLDPLDNTLTLIVETD